VKEMTTEPQSVQSEKRMKSGLAIMGVFLLVLLPLGLILDSQPIVYLLTLVLCLPVGIWDGRRQYPSLAKVAAAQATWRQTGDMTKRFYVGLILTGIAVFVISLIKGPLHGVLIAILLGISFGLALGSVIWQIVLYLRRNKVSTAKQ
jgi:hypothetical protein